MKLVFCFICSAVTLIALFPLVCESAPDEERPGVTITYPPCNSIISDTITITAAAWDNIGVASVEFRFEFRGPGRGDTVKYSDIYYTDHVAPYEYIGFNTRQYDDRTSVWIWVTARDSTNNISREHLSCVRIDNSLE